MGFELTKWYLDAVGEEGELVVVYAADLRWGPIALRYASVLAKRPGEDASVRATLAADELPRADGDVVTWSCPELELSGTWTRLDAPVDATLLDEARGKVVWSCGQPRAAAQVSIAGRTVRGMGYVERLVVTLEPWKLPIDELRWGRFLGQRGSVVWIDWKGSHARHLVLHGGREFGPCRIDERGVHADEGGLALRFEGTAVLRQGTIGTTALSVVPALERFPARILALDETKWISRGFLTAADGEDRGWVIHEVVRWPAAPRDPSGSWAGKVLYGLLFAAFLPAMLVAWARATSSIVPGPSVHAPTAGVFVTAAGALLILGGWLGLWRDGGGLPMNAYPPPRLVTRGVYALVPHPIYVGFTAICAGVSIAVGSASGLWLVTPAIALAALALVLGYEKIDLVARFGDRVDPVLGRPRTGEARGPSWGARAARRAWQPLRRWAERRANSWREWRLGPLRVINHALWAALSSFGGIVIIVSLVGPAHLVAVAVAAVAGLLGAGAWAQWIEGASGLSRPYGFYGGLLGICVASLLAPLWGTPVWLLLGAYAVAGPYVQAMGRVRCLVQGCCHGRPTDPDVGIRVHHPRSRVCRIAHLDDVPVHATPLYSILWNAVTFAVVGTLWMTHARMHLVGGVFFLMNGLGRFVEEAYRGEPQTPVFGRLRLYQWVAIAHALTGAVLTAVGRSEPAPSPSLGPSSLALGLAFAVLNGLALGVDFPESDKKFSRLA